MTPVVDQTDIFRKYDFTSIVTKDDDREACRIIEQMISEGKYFTNSPRYQTNENLFGRPESVWLKYRMSFLFSLFMYLGREVKVSNMMAWSYMTNNEVPEDREKLWHNHWHPTNPNSEMISGIWYLHIPDDVKNWDYCGTEMAPVVTRDGPVKEHQIFIRPEYGKWLIWPSGYWHRPAPPQSSKYRFILAVDIEYLP
jgi:hypothetical protein